MYPDSVYDMIKVSSDAELADVGFGLIIKYFTYTSCLLLF